jgi:hypothetical protein
MSGPPAITRKEISDLRAAQGHNADSDNAGPSLSQLLGQEQDAPFALVHDAKELARFERIAQLALQAATPEQGRIHGTKPYVAARPALVVCLFTRSKYESEEAKSSKSLHAMLGQELYTPRSDLVVTLHRFTRPHGKTWTYRTTADAAPREVPTATLVAYMNMNPRDQIEPLLEFNRQVMGAVLTGARVPERLDHALVHSVHRGKQTKVCIEIDADTKDLAHIRSFIAKLAATVGGPLRLFEMVWFTVETRGGYHIVFQKDDFPRDTYQICALPEFAYSEPARDGKMVAKKYFDIRGDVCVPIPGTVQGGFPVRLLPDDEFVKFFS